MIFGMSEISIQDKIYIKANLKDQQIHLNRSMMLQARKAMDKLKVADTSPEIMDYL